MGDANNQDIAGAHALHPPTTKIILYYFFVKLTTATSIAHLRFQILLTQVDLSNAGSDHETKLFHYSFSE
jgi:hypothetical protein